MGIGDWGLGIGIGIHPRIPNPESRIPPIGIGDWDSRLNPEYGIPQIAIRDWVLGKRLKFSFKIKVLG